MSRESVARVVREAEERSACSSLVSEIALSTVLDPDLHRAVMARPLCVAAIARQVLHVAVLVSQTKARSLRKPDAKHVHMPTATTSTPLQAGLVIVGLGEVGTAVVDAWLTSQLFHPTSISIVTRQQYFPARFDALGVRCHNDAAACADTADLIVFACQPGQLAAAAKPFRDSERVRRSCVAMCVCAGITADKAAAELGRIPCVSADVDTRRLLKMAETWEQQDTNVARHRRLEYAASKSILPGASDSIGVASPSEVDRRVQQREAGFFADPVDFVHRATFALASACANRGVDVNTALAIAVGAVLRVELPPLDDKMAFHVNLVEETSVEKLVTRLDLSPAEIASRARECFAIATQLVSS
jgi:hypothetical protein